MVCRLEFVQKRRPVRMFCTEVVNERRQLLVEPESFHLTQMLDDGSVVVASGICHQVRPQSLPVRLEVCFRIDLGDAVSILPKRLEVVTRQHPLESRLAIALTNREVDQSVGIGPTELRAESVGNRLSLVG